MKGKSAKERIPAGDRLIHALDGMSLQEAHQAVRSLCGLIRLYKIGPSLVYAGGLDAANQLVRNDPEGQARIFLDMKTWDIPETLFTTLDAVREYAGEAVVFVTVHTQGLDLKTLAEGRGRRPFKVFAITHLTSQDEGDLRAMGVGLSQEDYVLQMAARARDFGCDGVVCSGHEVRRIKEAFGEDLLTITPGIRPAWSVVEGEDQKRVVTPRDAILNGADYLVVGRPIRSAADPLAAAGKIREEIEAALAEREKGKTQGTGARMAATV